MKKNKSLCLLSLLLILLSEVGGFVQVPHAAIPEDIVVPINHTDSWKGDLRTGPGPTDRSFGYGVETPGRVIASFIPPGIVPPMTVTRVFTTCQDWQTSVSIKVYEGDVNCNLEREQECLQYYKGELICESSWDCRAMEDLCSFTKDCFEHLGTVELHAIPSAPRGVPQIEVTLHLNSTNAKLHVTVMDKVTMKSNSNIFAYGVFRGMNIFYTNPFAERRTLLRKSDLPVVNPAKIDHDSVCFIGSSSISRNT